MWCLSGGEAFEGINVYPAFAIGCQANDMGLVTQHIAEELADSGDFPAHASILKLAKRLVASSYDHARQNKAFGNDRFRSRIEALIGRSMEIRSRGRPKSSVEK
jgi:hypothetical protein